MTASDAFDRAILNATPDGAADMMTRLARAARDFPRGRSALRLRRLIGGHLDHLAEAALMVAGETGEPVTSILARTIRGTNDPVLARRVAEKLGEPSPGLLSLGIACWTVIVSATLAAIDPADQGFPLRVAEEVAELVVWLNQAGRPAAAITIIRRALALLRRHGLPRPLGLMCQWAGMLIAIGHLEEAEKRLRQVLSLAEAQGADPLMMADEWINLANVRHAQGDTGGALEVSRHALHLLLRARGTPGDRADLLPDALGNHAIYLQDCGRPQAAIAAIRHVLAVVGKQAARSPDLHRPALVTALINASSIFATIGNMDEARICSARAVAHAKLLTRAAAAAHGNALVRSLINHAIDQENLGDAGFATEQARDALALARDLRSRHGNRFLDAEIDAATTLCHAGLHGEHLTEAREAGDAALALAERLPSAPRRHKLLEILPNLADVLSGLGETAAALRLSTEAHTLLTEMEAGEDLALVTRTGIRDVHARHLADNGDTAAAVTVIREAVAIALSSASDGTISNVLVHSLVHQSGILADLGDLDGALAAAQAGVDHARALGEHSPDWAAHELPTTLHALGRAHWQRGEFAQAGIPAAEMEDLARKAVAIDERSSLNDLASALEFSALIANAAGETDRAMARIDEAMIAYRRLLDLAGDGHWDDLANGLHNAATIALAAGDIDAAIRYQQEGADMLARFADPSPGTLKLEIEGLGNLAVYLATAERVEEGLAAIARARPCVDGLPADWLPGREAVIGLRVAEARLLVLAGHYAKAAALCETVTADMVSCGFDFWRGPALNARAMALASLGDSAALEAAREAFAFHRHLLETAGLDEDIHGLCDAAAVLIDLNPATAEDIVETVTPWLEHLPPARRDFAAGELLRSLSEHAPAFLLRGQE
jgi:tetratricopeptide (TPR) repeat protein